MYLKGRNWWEYQPKAGDNWYWKVICRIKDLVKQYYNESLLSNLPKFSIKQAYCSLVPSTRSIYWTRAVWCRLGQPKHRFITQLTMLERLNTKKRLLQMGITHDNTCLLCGVAEESHKHLFFECHFNLTCLHQITQWLGMARRHNDHPTMIKWVYRRTLNKFRKDAHYSIILCTVYNIWREGIMPYGMIMSNVQIQQLDQLKRMCIIDTTVFLMGQVLVYVSLV